MPRLFRLIAVALLLSLLSIICAVDAKSVGIRGLGKIIPQRVVNDECTPMVKLARRVTFKYVTSPETSYSGYRLSREDTYYLNETHNEWFKKNIMYLPTEQGYCDCRSEKIYCSIPCDRYIYFTGWTYTYGYASRLIQSFNDYNISFANVKFEWHGPHIPKEHVIFTLN